MGPLRTDNNNTMATAPIQQSTPTPEALSLMTRILNRSDDPHEGDLDLDSIQEFLHTTSSAIGELVAEKNSVPDEDAAELFGTVMGVINGNSALDRTGPFETFDHTKADQIVQASVIDRLREYLNGLLHAIGFDPHTELCGNITHLYGMVLIFQYLVVAVKAVPTGWVQSKGTGPAASLVAFVSLLCKDQLFGYPHPSPGLTDAKFVAGCLLLAHPGVAAVLLQQTNGRTFVNTLLAMVAEWASSNKGTPLSKTIVEEFEGPFKTHFVTSTFHVMTIPKSHKNAPSGITHDDAHAAAMLLVAAGVGGEFSVKENWGRLSVHMVECGQDGPHLAILQLLIKVMASVRYPNAPTVADCGSDHYGSGDVFRIAAEYAVDLASLLVWLQGDTFSSKKDGTPANPAGFARASPSVAFMPSEAMRCQFILEEIRRMCAKDDPILSLVLAAVANVLEPGIEFSPFKEDSPRFVLVKSVPGTIATMAPWSQEFLKCFAPQKTVQPREDILAKVVASARSKRPRAKKARVSEETGAEAEGAEAEGAEAGAEAEAEGAEAEGAEGAQSAMDVVDENTQ